MNQVDFLDWLADMHANPKIIRKPLVMGVLNVTPDSFSDGGKYISVDAAYDHAMSMVEQGVDLIDIGAESSRPGAIAISAQLELDRVMPVIERIRSAHPICISIDTYKPVVMHDAVQSGAGMINDIYALSYPDSLSMAAKLNVPVCIMHMQGTPENMQDNPKYSQNMMHDMHAFFAERIGTCISAGILSKHLLVDPGFGFGKTQEHNLEMVLNLSKYQRHGMPVVLGVSRKKTVGCWTADSSLIGRRNGGLALSVYGIMHGVSVLRTHDVLETVHAVNLFHAVTQGASS